MKQQARHSKMYHGQVLHSRLAPKKHHLRYKICSFLFDLDELDSLNKDLRYFGHNRWNIISFWNKDFGDGSGKSLKPYVEKTLKEAGYDYEFGPVRLLCYPRLWGFVFNPLSVYFCYDKHEKLRAIIYEVTNTFKQRHSYVIEVDEASPFPIRQSCSKNFYVSPFMEMEATYHFTIAPPNEKIGVTINQHDRNGPLLNASFAGKAEALSNASCLALLWRYPLMTMKVVAGIHWEALKLWRKGIKLVERPAPPEKPITSLPSLSRQHERFGHD